MFWHVLYNRPRGIPGNYKIVIAISLRGGELIDIERFGSSKDPAENIMIVGHNDIPLQKNPYRLTEIFALRRVIPGDSFRITITDPDVAYPQRNSYQATPEGLTGGLEAGSIELYHLHLVDLDAIASTSLEWNELFTIHSGGEWLVIGHIKQALNLS